MAVPTGATAPARAADGRSQLWLISTRAAPRFRPEPESFQRLKFWKLEDRCSWRPARLAQLTDCSSGQLPTILFVHGNRYTLSDAVRTGWVVYRFLDRLPSDRPFRVVIWSWPADRVSRRLRRDLRVKAARSDAQSYYLAECLRRVDPRTPLNLIGYSYGARVITGALELLAGGEVAGMRLAGPVEKRTGPIRAVLVAAAMDHDWLLPGHRHGSALDQVDRLLLTSNPRDPALRWYPLLYGRGGPAALGFAGPLCPDRLGPNRHKIELLPVACAVGRNHRWQAYFCAWPLRQRLGWYSFLDDQPGQPSRNGKSNPQPTAARPKAQDTRRPRNQLVAAGGQL